MLSLGACFLSPSVKHTVLHKGYNDWLTVDIRIVSPGYLNVCLKFYFFILFYFFFFMLKVLNLTFYLDITLELFSDTIIIILTNLYNVTYQAGPFLS
jgi:hypothetical protein